MNEFLTDQETICNIGADEYKVKAINYLCGAVFCKCAELNTNNIQTGFDEVFSKLRAFSVNHSLEKGISPITKTKYGSRSMLECLFELPGGALPNLDIYTWLESCYGGILGRIKDYKRTHADIYTHLKKRYRSGRKPSAYRRKRILFEAYKLSSPMNFVTPKEFDNIQELLCSEEYRKMLTGLEFPEDAATAFVLGMMYERAQAAEIVQKAAKTA